MSQVGKLILWRDEFLSSMEFAEQSWRGLCLWYNKFLRLYDDIGIFAAFNELRSSSSIPWWWYHRVVIFYCREGQVGGWTVAIRSNANNKAQFTSSHCIARPYRLEPSVHNAYNYTCKAFLRDVYGSALLSPSFMRLVIKSFSKLALAGSDSFFHCLICGRHN